jgi:hypothetical protein
MIIGMIKAHPRQNRMPRQQGASLAFAAQPVALAVEPVRVGWQDREVAAVDVLAVKVWRRRRDTEVRVRGVTVLRRRSGSRRPWSAGRGGRRPGPLCRGCCGSDRCGGRGLKRPVVTGHDAFALPPLRLVGDLLALGRPHGTLRHLGDRPDLWLGCWLARPSNAGSQQEGSQRNGPPPALIPTQSVRPWRPWWRW